MFLRGDIITEIKVIFALPSESDSASDNVQTCFNSVFDKGSRGLILWDLGLVKTGDYL